MAFSAAWLLWAPHGTHVPWMMSVLKQPIIVRNVGIMIQITTIAEYTRRFLALIYKTSNYSACSVDKLLFMLVVINMITIYTFYFTVSLTRNFVTE